MATKNKPEQESQRSFWTTLPGIFTGIAAVLTAIAGIIAALNTAGVFASHTAVPINTPTPAAAPTATFTLAAPPTATFTLAAPPTATFTPLAPPDFVTLYVYDLKGIEQVTLDFQAGIVPVETKTGFLQVSYVAYGKLENSDDGLNAKVTITNTGTDPLAMDLDKRFFSLEDSQGRTAEMAYFCCATKGEILRPSQQREMQMFFRLPQGWWGNKGGPDYILLNVHGLLPVVFSSWRVPLLKTTE